jgi:hypothetical protein
MKYYTCNKSSDALHEVQLTPLIMNRRIHSKLILRPKVSRPVRIDVGHPFRAHGQILNSLLAWQFLVSSKGPL